MNSRAMLFLLVIAVGVIMSCLQAAAETPCDNVNGKLQTRYADCILAWSSEYNESLNIQATCDDTSAMISWASHDSIYEVVVYYNCSKSEVNIIVMQNSVH